MESELIRSSDEHGSASRRRAQKLQAARLRVTSPRLAIMELLESNPSHPTAEQLFERLRNHHPSLSLSTVYKTLEVFLRAGVCRRISGEGTLLRVDGTLDPHDHAVCRSCGSIFDVATAAYPRPQPPSRLPGELEVRGVRVEYDVVCAACAHAGSSPDVSQRKPSNTPPGRGPGRGSRNKHQRMEV